ncbi:hypothetical protein FJN14_04230 [Alteromonas mediterranea]|uniref:Gfo/Idh/MocA family oxidoreductase n=1 Tax=Alteromonas mediterranea TaxID=314275 RepID=UPI001130AEE4|nr:Gfo/Idh/MocA family oxidoreductase [Alteromonas mediterranea]QDG37704.1 hypothetical protein FJN14_04230 [Alteromonas mediterranea]
MKVLIIGAGGFGKYHSLSLSQHDNELIVVDPSLEARSTVNKLLNRKSKSYSNLAAVDSAIPFDFCIIATSANIRVEQLLAVKRKFLVRKYLLEKVIINSIGDSEKLQTLDMKNIYVNYARRCYPFYQYLKNALNHIEALDIYIEGGDNALLCNAMHYIDLYEYITSSNITSVNTCLYGFKNAKRKGYVDAKGVIRAKSRIGSVVINNDGDSTKNVITIMSEENVLLQYLERDGILLDNIGLQWTTNIVVDQSALTQTQLAKNLEECAQLAEALPTNKMFIEALLEEEYFKKLSRVPIT